MVGPGGYAAAQRLSLGHAQPSSAPQTPQRARPGLMELLIFGKPGIRDAAPWGHGADCLNAAPSYRPR